MDFQYFKENEAKLFVVKVIEALQQRQGASFQAIANQLTKDLKENQNRAMRLAMKVNNAHDLNIAWEKL